MIIWDQLLLCLKARVFSTHGISKDSKPSPFVFLTFFFLTSSLLHHLLSEPELGNNMSTIGELSQRLLSRRPNVEPILSQLFLQPGTNLVVETSDGLSTEQCDVKDSNSKAKENSIAVEVETVNPCSEVLSSVSYDQDGCNFGWPSPVLILIGLFASCLILKK
jgi:hypothetical protein